MALPVCEEDALPVWLEEALPVIDGDVELVTMALPICEEEALIGVEGELGVADGN